MKYQFGEYELDSTRFELLRAGEPVSTTAKAFDLLVYLIEHRDRVVSRQELEAAIWAGASLSPSTLPTAVSDAREAIGDHEARVIRNVRGDGYRFAAPVNQGETNQADSPPPASELLGRQPLLEAFQRSIQQAQQGRGSLLFLAGQAGIGKTRGLEEFVQCARAAGLLVFMARSDERSGDSGFAPWVQLLSELVSVLPSDSLREVLGPALADIAQIVPSLRAEFADSQPVQELPLEQLRFRLFDSVATLIRHSAREQPLALVFDDLQWADPSSTLLLEFISHDLAMESAIVVGAYRSEEVKDSFERTLGTLASCPVFSRFELEGLSATESVQLARNLSRGRLEDSVAEDLFAKTEGNPFFITEMVRWRDSESASVGDPLPENVRGVIERRLARLPSECREVLRLGSVIGRSFDCEFLAPLADRTGAQLLDLLQPALDAGVVSEERENFARYRFCHELIREVLYAELVPSRRAELHGEVGEAIERSDAASHLTELSHHFRMALEAGGSVERAFDYAKAAANDAFGRMAYEDAAHHYEQALDLRQQIQRGQDKDHCELYLRLGESLKWAGQPELSRTAFGTAAELARALAWPDALARAALGATTDFSPFVSRVLDPLEERLLEDAIVAVEEHDPALQAKLLARLSYILIWSGQIDRCIETGARAVATARRSDDKAALAEALASYYLAVDRTWILEKRLALTDEMVQAGAESGDPVLELRCMAIAFTDVMAGGDRPGLETLVEGMVRVAEESRQLPLRIWANIFLATMTMMDGDYEESERLALEYLEWGKRFHDFGVFELFAAQLFVIRHEQGRLGEIESAVRDQVERQPEYATWIVILSLVLAQMGRVEEAQEEYEKVAVDGFRSLPQDNTLTATMVIVCYLCCQFRDKRRAASIERILEPQAERHAVAGIGAYGGAVARCLALLADLQGREAEAERLFKKAIAKTAAVSSPTWLARTRYEYAEHLVRRGGAEREQQARTLLEEAIPMAKKFGLRLVSRDAENLQRRLDALPASE